MAPTSTALFDPPAPGSAPLNLTQIADRFGRTPSQYGGIESYFTAEGLTVSDLDPTRLSITVQGPAADVERAFGTQLWNGTYQGASVRYPSNAPVLPAAIRATES